MMTFGINAIKQEDDHQQQVEFFLEVDSDVMVRKVFEKTGLVLLSVKDVEGSGVGLGPLYLTFLYEGGVLRAIGTEKLSLKDFCLFFVSLGFDVSDVNYFEDIQSPEQVQKILDFCQHEVSDKQKATQLVAQKNQDSQKKIYYGNEGLDKAKSVINWSIDKVTVLLEQKGAYISSKDLRSIKEKIEELKKLRMGANYEKIRDMLQELFTIVDRIEEEYFDSVQDQGGSLFEGTSVTSLDMERQISILEKVYQQQQFGGSVSTQRKDYIALGEGLVYLLFLKKDFVAVLGRFSQILQYLFSFLEVGVVILLVVFALAVFAGIMITGEVSFSGSIDLIFWGMFGCFVALGSFLKKKSFWIQGLAFIVICLCSVVLFPIIKHSFALG